MPGSRKQNLYTNLRLVMCDMGFSIAEIIAIAPAFYRLTADEILEVLISAKGKSREEFLDIGNKYGVIK